MKLSQQGMVLFSVMILLLLISMNILSQLQSVNLLLKLLSSQQQEDNSRWDMENTLRNLINDSKWPAGFTNTVSNNNITYELISVDLGMEPCLLIDNKPSHHWLIYLKNKKAILTVRLAKNTNIEARCTSSFYRIIHSGIQSWYQADSSQVKTFA